MGPAREELPDGHFAPVVVSSESSLLAASGDATGPGRVTLPDGRWAPVVVLHGGAGGGVVTSVNGEDGDVTLDAADVGALAPPVGAGASTVIGYNLGGDYSPVPYSQDTTGFNLVMRDIQGEVPTPAPTQGTSATNKSYVDTGLAAKANDNAVVHLAATETISGQKTFSGAIISTGAANAILQSAAGFYFVPAVRTAAVTLGTTSPFANLCNATTAPFSVTIPTAVGRAGQAYMFKKTDASANAVTVATTSSQTIDGAASYVLSAQYSYVWVISDGANWLIFGKS